MKDKDIALMAKVKTMYAKYLINRFGVEAQKINAARLNIYMESFVWNKGE